MKRLVFLLLPVVACTCPPRNVPADRELVWGDGELGPLASHLAAIHPGPLPLYIRFAKLRPEDAVDPAFSRFCFGGYNAFDPTERFIFSVPDHELEWWTDPAQGDGRADQLGKIAALKNYVCPGTGFTVQRSRCFRDSDGNRVTPVLLGDGWCVRDAEEISVPARDDVIIRDEALLAHATFADEARRERHSATVNTALVQLGRERDLWRTHAVAARIASQPQREEAARRLVERRKAAEVRRKAAEEQTLSAMQRAVEQGRKNNPL